MSMLFLALPFIVQSLAEVKSREDRSWWFKQFCVNVKLILPNPDDTSS